MIDNRRLNTAAVIGLGILNMPPPISKVPADAVLNKIDGYESGATEESVRAGLIAGGIEASMYYGCFNAWKTVKGFDGELFQYRNRVAEFADCNIEQAIEKILEWSAVCYG